MSDKRLSASFVVKHGLWSVEQHEQSHRLSATIEEQGLTTIRLGFADQHGILRGKTIAARELPKMLESGCTVPSTLLAKDTSHRSVFPVFAAGGGFGMREMQGAGDVLMVADPGTFRVIPWAPSTGWILCDLYFGDGRPVPFSTRGLYKAVLADLDKRGFAFRAGLEVEFHVFKLKDARLDPRDAGQPGRPPEVNLLSRGYQYLTEQRYDEVEPVLELIRTNVEAIGLPVRSLEVEMGPSQFEFTFAPADGLAPADNMMLFRNAVKQIAQRHGYHATFMCRPRIPNVVSSGWHLHQSLVSRQDGSSAFMSRRADQQFSALASGFLAGLLEHGRASTVFSTPTINGYKRYRPYSLAPDRVAWARDNRGAMIRVLGGPNDPATRFENRIGEPAANPYLYLASQVLAGLDGVDRSLDPGPSADVPYEIEAKPLPKTLQEAVFALKEDPFFRKAMGPEFVDYYVFIKNAEIERFQMEVTEWEQAEYFDIF
jgi:glutamine synthetase